MSGLEAFLFENVEQEEIVERAVSKRFRDKEGNPIKWVFKSIDSDRDLELRKECTKRVPVPGKKNMVVPEIDMGLYATKLIVESTVFPDLYNAKLQDSWGVKTPEALVKKMLFPGEFIKAQQIVQEINGYDTDMNELVEQAKN